MLRRMINGPIVAGKETRFLDYGSYFLTHEQLTLTAVGSTLKKTPQDEERVQKAFEEARQKTLTFLMVLYGDMREVGEFKAELILQ